MAKVKAVFIGKNREESPHQKKTNSDHYTLWNTCDPPILIMIDVLLSEMHNFQKNHRLFFLNKKNGKIFNKFSKVCKESSLKVKDILTVSVVSQ